MLQVVMCAVWGGGKLGLAFYLVETAHLHIMPDRAESEDFGLLKRGGSGQSSAVDSCSNENSLHVEDVIR